MNKKAIVISVLLVILPLIIGIGLAYVNQELISYAERMYEMTWVLIWKGLKSIPIFAYVIGMFVAIKSVLAKQKRGVLSGCAFTGALIVILSFILPLLLGIGVFDISFSILTISHYQLLAPLAIGNMILGVYIMKKKSIQ